MNKCRDAKFSRIGLLVVIFFIFSNFNNMIPKSLDLQSGIPLNNEDISFIHIDGNDISKGWNQCPWVNGSGTFSNPYIIKNLVIYASGRSRPIWIENTRAYFVIRNCTIYNALAGDFFAGICLSYCSNGTIEGNNCSFNMENGIILQYCMNMTIANNTCNNNENFGIFLYYSHNNTIFNNTAKSNSAKLAYEGRGLYLYGSNNLVVNSNYFASNEREGCIVLYSTNINFTANEFIQNQADGLDLFESDRFQIWNNNFNSNGWGMQIRRTDHVETAFNLFNNNTYHIYLEDAEFNEIHHNNCSEGYMGIQLYACLKYNNISCNIITQIKNHGVQISNSYDVTFSNNSFGNCDVRLIGNLVMLNSLEIASDNLINKKPLRVYYNTTSIESILNTGQFILINCNDSLFEDFKDMLYFSSYFSQNVVVFNNSLAGLAIYNSEKISVQNNTCPNDFNGYYLLDSKNLNIYGNNCSINEAGSYVGYGIYGENLVQSNITHNICTKNFDDGVLLTESKFCIIAENNCSKNKDYGIVVGGGLNAMNNTIRKNICNQNRMGVRFGGYNSTLEGNTCNLNIEEGIYFDSGRDSPIVNNICSQNGGIGIYITDDYGIAVNNTCTQNTDYGMSLAYAQFCLIKNNTCMNNPGIGIRLGVWAHNNTLISNLCKSNKGFGIQLSASANNTLLNNTCIYNSKEGISVEYQQNTLIGNNCSLNLVYSGIKVMTANKTQLINNTCNQNDDYGISLSKSHYCLIEGNNCSKNDLSGLFLTESHNNTVRRNYCDANYNGGILISSSDYNTIYLNRAKANLYDFGISGTNNLVYDNFWGSGPFAYFLANTTLINYQEEIAFTDLSFGGSGISHYQWNFGDGPINSTLQNPIHLFTTSGSFTVTLTVNDTSGKKSIYRRNVTVLPDFEPIAHFDANKTQIYSGNSVFFTDASYSGNRPFFYEWDFGDLSQHSKLQNPTHRFEYGGLYIVTLTVTDKDLDSDTYSLDINVIPRVIPTVNFTQNATSIIEKQYIQFFDQTTGGNPPYTYQWNFGDGGVNNTGQNPIHRFQNDGTFTVILMVTDDAGDRNVFSRQIFVENDISAYVFYETNRTTIIQNQWIGFTIYSLSGNLPISFEWDFGDGSPHSYETSPIHQYTSNGTFYPSVHIIDADGDISSHTRNLNVIFDRFPYAEFQINSTLMIQGEWIQFDDLSLEGNGELSYQWNFGDGSNNNTNKDPIHHYVSFGEMVVTLTVRDEDGDRSVYALPITIIPDLEPSVSFTCSAIKVLINQSVVFTIISSTGNNPLTYQWNFGDGTGIDDVQNPTHEYLALGTYTVVLYIIDIDGDVGEATIEIQVVEKIENENPGLQVVLVFISVIGFNAAVGVIAVILKRRMKLAKH